MGSAARSCSTSLLRSLPNPATSRSGPLSDQAAPVGELVITRLNDPACLEPFCCTCLRIDQADPRIRIAAEALAQIVEGPVVPHVSLTPADEPLEGCWPRDWSRLSGWEGKSPLGAIFRVKGINQ